MPRSLSLAVALLLPMLAHAGPVQDFERQLTDVYAHYRAALMQTNQKNQPATEAAIAQFEKGWAGIVARKASPPPQYVGDAKWGETLDKVAAILEKAKTQAAKGDLTQSHETLEAIRYAVAEMRQRNGIVAFSDHMNAYHEQMEIVVAGKYEPGAEGVARLREDVAVLAFLAAEVDRNKPASLAADEAFTQGLAALKASVAALQAAARKGETAKLDELRKALKPPYSRLFVKYG
jgi:hypothetical protein